MDKKLARTIKSRQIKPQMLFIKFDGSVATPVAEGADARAVSEITKNGTGDYTVVLVNTSKNDVVPGGFFTEEDRITKVTAVDVDRITVVTRDAAWDSAAGAVADADSVVYLTLFVFDGRLTY